MKRKLDGTRVGKMREGTLAKRSVALMLAGQVQGPRGGPAGPAKRALGFMKDGNQM